MEGVQTQFGLKIEKIGEKFSHYFYGKTFPVQAALIAVLGYIADLPLVALLIYSLLASFIFIFYKNLAPIIPLFLTVIIIFNDYSIMNGVVPYLLLIPAGVSFVAHFFIHPVKWQRPSKFFYALIAITLAFAFAGITRPDYDFAFGIAYLVSLGPVLMVVYLLFLNYLPDKKDFHVQKYLCYTLMVTGLAMCLEIVYCRFVKISLSPWAWAELGWGNVNGCAAFLLLSIPATYYLMVKSRIIYPYLICILALYAGMFVGGSDAAFAIAALSSPFLIFYTYRHVYRTKRKVFTYTVLSIFLALVVVVLVFLIKFGFYNMLKMFQLDPSSSGREAIFSMAMKLFKENPLFGYGFQYADPHIDEYSPVRLYNFHSTFFHVIATMGICGLIAYIFYFVVRFAILMKNNTPFIMIMLTAFVMFECYALVDTGEFNAIPLMCSITLIITVVEQINKGQHKSYTLPLSTNKRRGYFF